MGQFEKVFKDVVPLQRIILKYECLQESLNR